MNLKTATIAFLLFLLSATSSASFECLPLLIAPEFTMKSSLWKDIHSQYWGQPTLLNQSVQISARDGLGISRTYTGLLTQASTESFDMRHESNGFSDFRIQGVDKPIPRARTLALRVQVSGDLSQNNNNIPAFARGWAQVPKSKWHLPELENTPVALVIRNDLGFLQFIITKIVALSQETLAGQKDLSVSPFVLSNGQRVEQRMVENILLISDKPAAKRKDWVSIEPQYWLSPELVGQQVAITFRSSLGVERTIEGTVDAVPKQQRNEKEELSTTPYMINGQPINVDSVSEIRVKP